jgi:hypothetical protein
MTPISPDLWFGIARAHPPAPRPAAGGLGPVLMKLGFPACRRRLRPRSLTLYRGSGIIAGMDPISLIVAAVVAGAATGIKDQAAQAVKDAYGALKRLLTDRHQVDVAALERKPDSEAKQASLTEDLGDTGAAADPAVMTAARHLVEEVRKHDAAGARAVGVDIDDVSAEFVRVSNVAVSGSGVGVDIDRVMARGGLVVEGVQVDAEGAHDHP